MADDALVTLAENIIRSDDAHFGAGLIEGHLLEAVLAERDECVRIADDAYRNIRDGSDWRRLQKEPRHEQRWEDVAFT